MSKVKGKYWKTDEKTVKLQLKTDKEQYMLEEALPGWQCVSYGYIPKTKEDIYVFQKKFETDRDWLSFLKSEKLTRLIELKEVSHD